MEISGEVMMIHPTASSTAFSDKTIDEDKVIKGVLIGWIINIIISK